VIDNLEGLILPFESVTLRRRVAKTTNQLALLVDDANPRPKVGDVVAYGSGRTDPNRSAP